ncbi:copper homeostasis membrane protein CopD [Bradyrhizobium sp.]|uniref:copper homeostasis membrane protein CopD n=1 Tax=Bradyrhizobium sp. TaxID=376 RepID=UPI001EBBA40F|nr:copper homeostasis membrane protein CopD [Bradyrhizobium sp.]MBV9981938.1 copper homeostasis membrane protein CopD [Bradyrhizobium sp.]
MSWSEAGLGDGLIAVRAVHFAATANTLGALIFRSLIAEPAFGATPEAVPVLAAQIRKLAWTSLVIAVLTGLGWLLLETMQITGLSLWDALTQEGLSTVVEVTQFGQVTVIRLALAVLLAISLAGERVWPVRRLTLVSALAFTGAIAWTGHAGSTAGDLGSLHLVSDVLHLWAASAWIGGLVLLMSLLNSSARHQSAAWRKLEQNAVSRFSLLGIVAVSTLVLSGAINAWIIVRSWQVLLATAYGQLLLVKIAVVALMVAFACVNRLWLTPQLAATAAADASLQLARNSGIEFALGLAVFAIVGALGLQHPMIHP